jgi:hypothetical protein
LLITISLIYGSVCCAASYVGLSIYGNIPTCIL